MDPPFDYEHEHEHRCAEHEHGLGLSSIPISVRSNRTVIVRTVLGFVHGVGWKRFQPVGVG